MFSCAGDPLCLDVELITEDEIDIEEMADVLELVLINYESRGEGRFSRYSTLDK